MSASKVRETLHKLGYKYKDYGGMEVFGAKNNEYFNLAGQSVSRDEFWKKFDLENGAEPIPTHKSKL